MPFDYVVDPKAIEKNSFEMIRKLTDLDGLDQSQQQVVMRIVHSVGMPEVADKVKFSANACESGQAALAAGKAILCDVEMVKQGITKRMIQQPPLCLLNDPRTVELAKASGETRSMAALELWGDDLAGSIVVIGNAPTALFRLLEMIEQANEKDGGKDGKAGKDSKNKPALIIGMPVGFIGAAESKQALWDVHERLGIECITLLGNQGGSAVSSATCNALLRCNIGEIY
ncbi:MAG: precorrin-8X methylmutase [Oleispira sp.]|nr:precorrin-8X methylmutase [Oleispira sp.]MBL4882673.1 precorrin-8X methylmutase [Oleispira sp.]